MIHYFFGQSSIYRQVGATTIARSINILAALAVAMVLTRLLPEALYGAYRKLWLVYAFLAPLAISAFVNGLYYRGSVLDKNRSTAIGVALLLSFIAAILFGFINFAGAPLWSRWLNAPAYEAAFRNFSLYTCFTIFSGTAEPLFVLLKRKKWLVLYNLGYNLVEGAIIILAFLYLLPLQDIALIMAAGPALRTLFLFVLLALSDISIPSVKQIWGELLSFSRYAAGVLGTAFVGLAVHDVDKWIVGNFFDSDTLYAIYSIGARKLPLSVITGSIASSLIVHYSNNMADNDYTQVLGAIKTATNRLILFLAPFILFSVIFAEELMILIYQKYAASADIFRIYVLTTLFTFFLPNVLILGKGHSFVQAKFSMVDLAINIVLSLWLIRVFGLIGPAIATFIGALFYTLFQLLYCKYTFNINALAFMPSKKTGPVAAIMLIYGVTTYFIQQNVTMVTGFVCGLILLGMVLLIHYVTIYKKVKK